jgi:hypothetical protein
MHNGVLLTVNRKLGIPIIDLAYTINTYNLVFKRIKKCNHDEKYLRRIEKDDL